MRDVRGQACNLIQRSLRDVADKRTGPQRRGGSEGAGHVSAQSQAEGSGQRAAQVCSLRQNRAWQAAPSVWSRGRKELRLGGGERLCVWALALAVTGDSMGSPGRVWAEDSWGRGHNRGGRAEASCVRFCVYLQQPLGALGWSGYHVNPTSPPLPPPKLDHPVVNFLKQWCTNQKKKKKRFDRNFNWACVGKFLKCSGCDSRLS